jgi:hypothetical protein
MLQLGLGLCSLPVQSTGDGSNPALNTPTLVVQEGGVDTHVEDEGADLTALVTVDDGDGSVTTDVELYVNGALISSMDDDGGGDWSLAIPDVTAGTKNYRAKRITADGFRYSAFWQVVVSGSAGNAVIAGAGNQVIAGAGNRVVANL